MVGTEPGIQQTSGYCCLYLLSHLINGPTEAQKMLEVPEPLDSKAGCCDSESSPGGTSLPCLASSRACSRAPLPWRAAPTLPLSCCRRLSGSRWRCPGAGGRLRRATHALLFAFLSTAPSWSGRTWAWGQVCGRGGPGCLLPSLSYW